MKIFCFTIFILLTNLIGSYGQCGTKEVPYASGEKLNYTGYFHWGIIWISAGSVSLSVNSSNYAGKKTYRIKGSGRSASSYDMFFKLRDTLITHLDANTADPLFLDRRTHEGKYTAHHIYKVDAKNRIINFNIQKREDSPKIGTLSYEGCLNNIFSILYFARSLDYGSFKEGTVIPVQILVDGKISHVEIRYRGISEVRIRGREKYKCYKITPVLPEGSMFKKGDDMIIWLTCDANKIPLMIEGKIPVGSVKAILENYEGLKHKDNVLGNQKGVLK